MGRIRRGSRIVIATILAFALGSVPACGTMGGSGMKYFWAPPSEAQYHVST
jgi:hypothetical protein